MLWSHFLGPILWVLRSALGLSGASLIIFYVYSACVEQFHSRPFEGGLSSYASLTDFRANFVSSRAVITHFQSLFCHAKCLSYMCLTTPWMAFQGSPTFLHALAAFQWLFRRILACFVHCFWLVWWVLICFIYMPCKPCLLDNIACYFSPSC